MGADKPALAIHLAPLLPEPMMMLVISAVILLCLLSAIFYKRGLLWRGICGLAFIALLLNPSLIEQLREPVKDVAIVVVDRSSSQDNGKRTERTDAALKEIKAKLSGNDNLELRIIEAPQGTNLTRDTLLFSAIDSTFTDVPPDRRAGVIIISDGQIHDVPKDPEVFHAYGPVHLLLTGDKNEKDRQLVITEAPAYGIVGQNVTIRYRVEDTKNTDNEYATMLIRNNNITARPHIIPVNEEQTLEITIDHAGQNIIDMEVSALDDEITTANNRVPLIINGVRDRLKVLLVSGQPHAGGRTWRDMLTADPGVDLVHFTILREPSKLDATPQNELSLIAFPFRELFEVKLYDFDLIIFDRYRLNLVLPSYYFANIARYVTDGGALLEASGPSFAENNSIYTTALQDVLPASPTGNIINKPFIPDITSIGKRHPVTQSLGWQGGHTNNPKWGSWLRQVSVQLKQGDVLMTGADKNPLLILSRAGEGRVAQLSSDQIWLWARGFEGGGPHTELLRRLAHWLMKEPELDENALEVSIDNNILKIRRRSLHEDEIQVTVTSPSGIEDTITLKSSANDWPEAEMKAEELGVYIINDNKNTRFVIAGDYNPPELRGVISTDALVRTVVEATKGGIYRLADNGVPAIHILNKKRRYSGTDWMGLRQNGAFNITGIKDKPFLPDWLYAILLLSLLVSTWWFEGNRN